MTVLVVLLDLLFVLVAFGVRSLIQLRRTGDPGWRLGRPHSRAEAIGRGLLLAAAGLLVLGLVLDLVLGDPTATGVGSLIGLMIAVAAVGLVAVAQLQMGASWRIGIDPTEQTTLVRSGLYSAMRNPIYTGMVAFVVGQALMLPSAWTVAAVVAVAIGVEIQVRAVEEPYLLAVHGTSFAGWASSSGRFVPGLGRLA